MVQVVHAKEQQGWPRTLDTDLGGQPESGAHILERRAIEKQLGCGLGFNSIVDQQRVHSPISKRTHLMPRKFIARDAVCVEAKFSGCASRM